MASYPFEYEYRLNKAIHEDNLDAVNDLIKKGVDLNIYINQEIPLRAACSNKGKNQKAIIMALVNAGAPINSGFPYSPLDSLIKNGLEEEAIYLVRKGATIQIRGIYGITTTPLELAKEKGLTKLVLIIEKKMMSQKE